VSLHVHSGGERHLALLRWRDRVEPIAVCGIFTVLYLGEVDCIASFRNNIDFAVFCFPVAIDNYMAAAD